MGASTIFSLFVDKDLFEIFLETLSRRYLIDWLRNDESFRNRYFPGFRITATTPNQAQMCAAFRREIVQNHNHLLANALCRQWVRTNHELASAALESIGLSSEHAADINMWLSEIQTKLNTEGLDCIRILVRAVAKDYSRDDVLTFVSICGYGRDQQALRQLVEQEMASQEKPAEDVDEKKQLETQLESARATLDALEQSREELQRQLQRELEAAQKNLEMAVTQANELDSDIAQIVEDIDLRAKSIEEARRELNEREKSLAAQTKIRDKLLKHVERQRLGLTSMAMSHASQLSDAEKRQKEQVDLINRLTAQVIAIEERISVVTAVSSSQATSENEASPQLLTRTSDSSAVSREQVGNNAICYQGIQRVFRNAIVAFLRERLPRIFPTDHTQRVKKLFGEQWETAAQNAAKSRAIGGTNTTVRDEYDLLGTNHFFEIFDKFYDKLFTPEAGQPSTLPKPVKTKVLGNLKTIKDGRDPLSHPVEEEVSFEEAYHLLIEAKQILSWLGFNEEAEEMSTLATKLDGAEGEPPSIVSRLPSEDSIYQEFVGRDTVLTELAACFANPDNRRALLAGDGGKGKSAVAYRFAQSVARLPGRFQLIVWLSAKRRKFDQGTPVAIELPDFTTAAEAVDRLLDEYGATASDLTKPIDEKRQLLREYLDTLPAFIIADDIDTVLEDYEVVSLFTHEIPQTRSAVLLTSRRDIPGIRSFVIKGFDPAEAAEFVASRIQLYGLDAAGFLPSIVSEISKATDGSPLYMDDLLRLMRILDVKNAIKIWNDKKGDAARRYALERELEKLSPDAKRILIAAAITDSPISFDELESILELSEDRLFSGLSELQTLFLFPKPRLVEGEQRFQINSNTKKLVRLVESNSDLYARIERASKVLAGELPDVGKGVVSSLIRQAYLRLNADKPEEAEAILLNAIEKYPNSPDLRGFLGYVYKREGRVADARAQFSSASKMKNVRRDTFLHWVKMEIGVKEWSKALAVADSAIKAYPDFYEMAERKTYALRQLGFDLHRGLHHEKAEKMWSEAVDCVKHVIKVPETLPVGARQLNASMFRSMVICLHMLGRDQECNEWLDRWEREHPDDPEVVRQKQFLKSKRASSFY